MKAAREVLVTINHYGNVWRIKSQDPLSLKTYEYIVNMLFRPGRLSYVVSFTIQRTANQANGFTLTDLLPLRGSMPTRWRNERNYILTNSMGAPYIGARYGQTKHTIIIHYARTLLNTVWRAVGLAPTVEAARWLAVEYSTAAINGTIDSVPECYTVDWYYIHANTILYSSKEQSEFISNISLCIENKTENLFARF